MSKFKKEWVCRVHSKCLFPVFPFLVPVNHNLMASFRMDISAADVKIRVSSLGPWLTWVEPCSSLFILCWLGKSFWVNSQSIIWTGKIYPESSPVSPPLYRAHPQCLLPWCQLASDVFLFPRIITIGIISLTGLPPANILSEEWVSITGSNMSQKLSLNKKNHQNIPVIS